MVWGNIGKSVYCPFVDFICIFVNWKPTLTISRLQYFAGKLMRLCLSTWNSFSKFICLLYFFNLDALPCLRLVILIYSSAPLLQYLYTLFALPPLPGFLIKTLNFWLCLLLIFFGSDLTSRHWSICLILSLDLKGKVSFLPLRRDRFRSEGYSTKMSCFSLLSFSMLCWLDGLFVDLV